MQKTKLKKTAIVSLAEQIIEDSNKAMSTQEIEAKFNPTFPFQIKCVVAVDCTEVGEVITVKRKYIDKGPCSCGNSAAREKGLGYLYSGGLKQNPLFTCSNCKDEFAAGKLAMWVLI